MKTMKSAEVCRNFGAVRELALREPVMVSSYGRDSVVILPVDEYQRLKSMDTRKAYYPHELPDHLKAELEKGFQGEATPHLDHLLD